ncbi:hypothetical protein KHQ84_gp163 [Rhodococcus phage Finch]|uniref:Uncharacterized protein n=1 Tax=Rhodococcus phage Finch TaxID=2094144 RepID=A0A2P1JXL1_9CAUD|nr:hypothetical protein KHQ84_gp163 [Rhodococcus phage Finch]AVO25091.1 hypothetical protein SEA_FINCH_163 [Rhodococcus phage Finch]
MSDLVRNQMDDHECPGCGREIPDFMFTCSRCWEKLPFTLSTQVVRNNPTADYRLAARVKLFFEATSANGM